MNTTQITEALKERHPKFDKLAKWAQDELVYSEMHKQEAERRLALFANNTPSPIWYSQNYTDKLFIPKNDVVTFKVGEQRNEEIRITLQKDSLDNHMYLYISSADRAIVIEPAGGVNCMRVYPKTLLTNR